MMSEQDVSQILDPLIDGMMDCHDARICAAESHFRSVASMNGRNDLADVAFGDVTNAIHGMWSEIAKAAFWAGYQVGRNRG